ncbi:MAG: putative repeat protein (TIGR01451 family)/putative delta-60 repeat protein [Glaciecola sp.]|jgi:uncharacterized repeat protein (TIGR01451 family)/uncharacterized delta-60 repeat protein
MDKESILKYFQYCLRHFFLLVFFKAFNSPIKSLFSLVFCFLSAITVDSQSSEPGSVDVNYMSSDVGSHNNYPKFNIEKAVVDSLGRVTAIGRESYHDNSFSKIARFLPNGDEDPSFVMGTGFSGSSFWGFSDIGLQSDGSIILTGSFTEYNGVEVQDIIRLSPNGTLDNSFAFAGGNSTIGLISKVIVRNDSLFLAGKFNEISSGINLIKLGKDGNRDYSFGNYSDLYWLTNDVSSILDFKIDSFNRLYLCGKFTFRDTISVQGLARFLPNGRLDNSFKFDGSDVNGKIETIAPLSTGQTVIAGNSYQAGFMSRGMAKLNDNASIDETFEMFWASKTGTKMIVQPDDKILVYGYENNGYFFYQNESEGVIRIFPDGAIDTTFRQMLLPETYEVLHVEPKTNGYLLAGRIGVHGGRAFKNLVNIDFSGNLMPGFENLGTGIRGRVNKIVEASQGKVYILGEFDAIGNQRQGRIARLDSKGEYDPSFVTNGGFPTMDRSGNWLPPANPEDFMFLNENEELYLMGNTSFFYGDMVPSSVVKLQANGQRDSLFKISGFDYGWVIIDGMIPLTSGKFLAIGKYDGGVTQADKRVFRLNQDGSYDAAFGGDSGVDEAGITSYITKPNQDEVFISYTYYESGYEASVHVLDLNGDSIGHLGVFKGFPSNSKPITKIIERGSKFFIVGDFLTYDGDTVNNVLVLDSNFKRDSTFKSGSGFDGKVVDLEVTANGKLMFGGNFSKYNGVPANNLIQLNADGSVDVNFNSGTGIDGYGEIQEVTILNDGSVMVGGEFKSFNGVSKSNLVKIKGSPSLSKCKFDVGISEYQAITCDSTVGSVVMKGLYGTKPYKFKYLNVLNYTDSIAYVDKVGEVICVVTDATGCTDTVSTVMDGPDNLGYMDVEPFFSTIGFRPGFAISTELEVVNHGCAEAGDMVWIKYDSLLNYNSAIPAADSTDGYVAFWKYEKLNFGDSTFKVKIKFDVSLMSSIGDTVNIEVSGGSFASDFDTTNNLKNYQFPIINGYDPNDIAVYPMGLCGDGVIDSAQTLTYTIRFQNTGNAEAVNIHVIDSLDSDLDFATFKLISSSHDLQIVNYDDYVVKFQFDSIMLPDSAHNEPHSHGKIIYQIDSKSDISPVVNVFNRADIYFDYNPAVLTNKVRNIVVHDVSTMRCDDLGDSDIQKLSFIIAPNPNRGEFKIVGESRINALAIFDQAGRLVQAITPSNSQSSIEIQLDKSGVYFVHVQSGDVTEVLKAVVVR